MRFDEIKKALLTVTPNVYHYHAKGTKKPDKYIVWAEDGETGASHADNRKRKQAMGGTVDYFTKMEYDPAVEAIQTALNDAGIGWRLESIQYEEDTGYIHYEWVWEVSGPWHG